MKTITITFTIPAGGAVALLLFGAFDTFAAGLCKRFGWKLDSSKTKSGQSYTLVEQPVPEHHNVTKLADRRTHYAGYTPHTPNSPTAA